MMHTVENTASERPVARGLCLLLLLVILLCTGLFVFREWMVKMQQAEHILDANGVGLTKEHHTEARLFCVDRFVRWAIPGLCVDRAILLDGHVTPDALESLSRFPNLKEVHLVNSAITKRHLTRVGQLSNIEVLLLSGNRGINDDGLSRLIGLRALTRLDLTGTNITDDGIEYLSGMTKLQSLSLAHTHITDEGILRLKSLKHLKSLNLYGTNIEGKSFGNLDSSGTLQALNAGNTCISDAGLNSMRQLKSLKWLTLKGTHITNDGTSLLICFRGIEYLNIANTDIDGSVLSALLQLNRLTHLDVTGSRIAVDDIRRLKVQHPRVNVSY